MSTAPAPFGIDDFPDERVTLAEAAAWYAAHGWKVFPLHSAPGGHCSCGDPTCDSPGKHPRTSNGFKNASSDPAVVVAWWLRWPDANIGGIPASADRVVTDIDGPKGEEQAQALGLLAEPTPEVVTGRNEGGRHRHYRHPGGVVRNVQLDTDLDVRGDNGYVLLPPSVHSSGRIYIWRDTQYEPAELPPAVLAKLRGNSRDPDRPRPDQTPAWMLPWLEVGEGGRNSTLTRFVGWAYHAGHDEPTVLAMALGVNFRYRPPLEAEEVQAIVRSIGTREARKRVDAEATETPPPPAWPEPDPACFHGLVGEFVDLVGPQTEADPMALLLQFFACFGSALAAGPYYLVEGVQHRGNLFGVLVGASSRGRKGTAEAHVRRVFAVADPEWERNRIVSGLSSGEGLIWAVRDAISKTEPVKGEDKRIVDYRQVVVDPGIADKRLLVIEPEFASTLRVMRRDGSTLSPIIREAWDHRELLQSLTKNSPARATGAHISLIGHITADELRTELTETDRANGFANRFLFACVRRAQLLPDGGHVAAQARDALGWRVREAITFGRVQGQVERDAEARECWHAVYADLTADRPGLFGAVTARAEAQVTRLALLFALLDRSPVIRLPHLEAALAVWRYCEASCLWIFGTATGDRVADRIVEALQRAGTTGLTRTEISGLFDRHEPTDIISDRLRRLQAAGRAQPFTQRTAGRSVERWTCFASFSSFASQEAEKEEEVEGNMKRNKRKNMNNEIATTTQTSETSELGERSPDVGILPLKGDGTASVGGPPPKEPDLPSPSSPADGFDQPLPPASKLAQALARAVEQQPQKVSRILDVAGASTLWVLPGPTLALMSSDGLTTYASVPGGSGETPELLAELRDQLLPHQAAQRDHLNRRIAAVERGRPA